MWTISSKPDGAELVDRDEDADAAGRRDHHVGEHALPAAGLVQQHRPVAVRGASRSSRAPSPPSGAPPSSRPSTGERPSRHSQAAWSIVRRSASAASSPSRCQPIHFSMSFARGVEAGGAFHRLRRRHEGQRSAVEVMPLHQPPLVAGAGVEHGVGHAARLRDPLGEEIGVGLAARLGDRRAEQVEAEVRVERAGAGREQERIALEVRDLRRGRVAGVRVRPACRRSGPSRAAGPRSGSRGR